MHYFLSVVISKIRKNRKFAAEILGSLLVASLLGNSLCFMYFDEQSFGDSVWYSIISITTIGYGDFSATSIGARIGTIVFIVIFGLALFSICLGCFVEFFQSFVEKGRKGMSNIIESNHIILVNFPSAARVRQMIHELGQDVAYKKCPIVIVTDTIDELPFAYNHVSFVNGSPLEEDTYEQANLEEAKSVVVLSNDYNRPAESDAFVSSIVLVIEELRREVRTVAECLESKHLGLFKASHCDCIVCSQQLTTNLLVQEMQDEGVATVIKDILSNSTEDTLYSTTMINGSDMGPSNYAIAMLKHDINLLSIIHNGKSYSRINELPAVPIQSTLVYVADRRYTEDELTAMARNT